MRWKEEEEGEEEGGRGRGEREGKCEGEGGRGKRTNGRLVDICMPAFSLPAKQALETQTAFQALASIFPALQAHTTIPLGRGE